LCPAVPRSCGEWATRSISDEDLSDCRRPRPGATVPGVACWRCSSRALVVAVLVACELLYRVHLRRLPRRDRSDRGACRERLGAASSPRGVRHGQNASVALTAAAHTLSPCQQSFSSGERKPSVRACMSWLFSCCWSAAQGSVGDSDAGRHSGERRRERERGGGRPSLSRATGTGLSPSSVPSPQLLTRCSCPGRNVEADASP